VDTAVVALEGIVVVDTAAEVDIVVDRPLAVH